MFRRFFTDLGTMSKMSKDVPNDLWALPKLSVLWFSERTKLTLSAFLEYIFFGETELSFRRTIRRDLWVSSQSKEWESRIMREKWQVTFVLESAHFIYSAKFYTLFTWSGGPRSSGVSFFCFVSPRAWKQKKPTPLDRGPPLHVNRPLESYWDQLMFQGKWPPTPPLRQNFALSEK